MTLRELLIEGTEYLTCAELEDPATDAWILLADVFGCSRTDLLLHGNELISENAAIENYRESLHKRASHIPVQYITGKAPFMGMEFAVSPAVLIPRFDTEILVEEALKELSQLKAQGERLRVLDMCTGSGCIAISVAHKVDCYMTAVDLSTEALQIAEQNRNILLAEKDGAIERFTLLQSDMFTKVEGCFDCILSNPPYIPPHVIETLAPEVREKEPWMALDGGEDGLDFYRILAREGAARLVSGGKLLLEIGYDQGEAVLHLLYENQFIDGRIVKDLAGLDRVVVATRA